MTEEKSMVRPTPHPTEISRPFWEAARHHKLVIQQCSACDAYVFYPRLSCPYCAGSDLTWTQVSGRGTVYSFTIARRATHRLLSDRVPYIIAVIELAEGPRMTSTVVGHDPHLVTVDAAVTVAFEDHPDVTLPVFELVQRS